MNGCERILRKTLIIIIICATGIVCAIGNNSQWFAVKHKLPVREILRLTKQKTTILVLYVLFSRDLRIGDKKSSEYKNMYLLDRALQNLNLEALNILFKVKEDGDRVVEMNVRGESEVDGKDISVEYRPKIVGGLDALIQQADLTKWGVIP